MTLADRLAETMPRESTVDVDEHAARIAIVVARSRQVASEIRPSLVGDAPGRIPTSGRATCPPLGRRRAAAE